MAEDRKSIMAKCPEGFEDDLKAFIDDIEGRVKNRQACYLDRSAEQ